MAGLENQSIKLYFDDMGRVLVKQGIFISSDASFTIIETSSGKVEGIPTSKIVRLEVIK